MSNSGHERGSRSHIPHRPGSFSGPLRRGPRHVVSRSSRIISTTFSPSNFATVVPVPLTVKGAHHFLRFLWTSNPFYVVSAALFLIGLKLSFGAQAREVDSWALMGGLAGYTLLLASAALLLVRFARVWNDVRTVLLLVVLMFLATSVTFDELLVMEPERGRWFFIGGLVFSIALTEGLLRGIRLTPADSVSPALSPHTCTVLPVPTRA